MGADIAIVDGVRTPFCRVGTALRDIPAIGLGRLAVRELLDRTAIDPDLVDHVVVGTAAGIASGPVADIAAHANMARTIAIGAGIPSRVPAYTVNRTCASSLEAIAEAGRLIAAGAAEVVVAGGAESMSQFALSCATEAEGERAARTRVEPEGGRRRLGSRLRPQPPARAVALASRPHGLDSSLHVDASAEVLAKEWRISREAQDEFAFRSHRLAAAARAHLSEEIVPVYPRSGDKDVIKEDAIPRTDIARFEPLFDQRYGTVTEGNSAAHADGAVACLVTTQRRARELGLVPLGRIRSYAVTGLGPERSGLGPAYALPLALEAARITWRDIQLVEIDETSAAQVLANAAACASRRFATAELGRPVPIGEIDQSILNVNGGSIALGHAVGATGARIVLTLLGEMRRRDVNFGLATMNVSGGQGVAMVLER